MVFQFSAYSFGDLQNIVTPFDDFLRNYPQSQFCFGGISESFVCVTVRIPDFFFRDPLILSVFSPSSLS